MGSACGPLGHFTSCLCGERKRGALAPARRKTMKYVKSLGLAAIAAAALMAFVGATTASATVLCKTAPTGSTTGTTCPEGWAYPAGTEIHMTLTGTAKLTTTFKNYECTGSTMKGKTKNEGNASETVIVPLETLTYSGCNCQTVVLKPGTLEIHWIADTNNGTATASGEEETLSCSTIFGTMHCLITPTDHDVGTIIGGKEPEVITENRPLDPTSPLCEENPEWDGTYQVTSPKPLWIAAHT